MSNYSMVSFTAPTLVPVLGKVLPSSDPKTARVLVRTMMYRIKGSRTIVEFGFDGGSRNGNNGGDGWFKDKGAGSAIVSRKI
jgi:hypothetical protein